MTTVDTAKTEAAVAILRRAVPDATIVLFGSQGRGDAKSDSDLDLLIIEPVVKSRRKEMARLADLLRPLRIPVDVLVFSRAVFEKWSRIPGNVLYRAAKEGKVLDAAG